MAFPQKGKIPSGKAKIAPTPTHKPPVALKPGGSKKGGNPIMNAFGG